MSEGQEVDHAGKAKLIKQILGTVSIKAADAREYLELDNWLQDIESGVLHVVIAGTAGE